MHKLGQCILSLTQQCTKLNFGFVYCNAVRFCPLSRRLLVWQDAFFYSLVYDPQQKTLLADKGEIRVGNKYQADITDLLKEGKTSLRLIELDMVKALQMRPLTHHIFNSCFHLVFLLVSPHINI